MKKYFTEENESYFNLYYPKKDHQNRINEDLDIYCWKEKKFINTIIESNMYHFLAILNYFGIVALQIKSIVL